MQETQDVVGIVPINGDPGKAGIFDGLEQVAAVQIDGQGEDVGAGHHDLAHPQFSEAQEVLDKIPLHLGNQAPEVALLHHADEILLVQRRHLEVGTKSHGGQQSPG